MTENKLNFDDLSQIYIELLGKVIPQSIGIIHDSIDICCPDKLKIDDVPNNAIARRMIINTVLEIKRKTNLNSKEIEQKRAELIQLMKEDIYNLWSCCHDINMLKQVLNQPEIEIPTINWVKIGEIK